MKIILKSVGPSSEFSRDWSMLVNKAEGASGATCAGGCQSRGELLVTFMTRAGRVFVSKTCPMLICHMEVS